MNSPESPSSAEIKIPHGYARVTGQSQKGDGRWNGQRFARVKKEYPAILIDDVVIRRCVVTQEPLPLPLPPETVEWD
jgi:hypothetical protein